MAPGCLLSSGQNMRQAEAMIWHQSSPNYKCFWNQQANVNDDSPPMCQRSKDGATSCAHGGCGWRWTRSSRVLQAQQNSSVPAGNLDQTGSVNNETHLPPIEVLHRSARCKTPHTNAHSTCWADMVVIVMARSEICPSATSSHWTGVTELILLHTCPSFGTLLFVPCDWYG